MTDDYNLQQELLYDDFLTIWEEQYSAVELAQGNIDVQEAPIEEEKKGVVSTVPMNEELKVSQSFSIDHSMQEMQQIIFETPTP